MVVRLDAGNGNQESSASRCFTASHHASDANSCVIETECSIILILLETQTVDSIILV